MPLNTLSFSLCWKISSLWYKVKTCIYNSLCSIPLTMLLAYQPKLTRWMPANRLTCRYVWITTHSKYSIYVHSNIPLPSTWSVIISKNYWVFTIWLVYSRQSYVAIFDTGSQMKKQVGRTLLSSWKVIDTQVSEMNFALGHTDAQIQNL